MPRASPAAIAAESVQPVPCVLRVSMRSASKPLDALGRHQQVHGFRPVPMPALDQDAPRAALQKSLALPDHGGFILRDVFVQQRGRFRQVGRDQQGTRDQDLAQRDDGVLRQQPVAARRHHHGVEHDLGDPVPVEAAATVSITPACDSMPIFTAPTARSEKTESICAAMKPAGTS